MRRRLVRSGWIAIAAALAVGACAGRHPLPDTPPEELYRLAEEAVEDKDYEDARQLIDQIRDEFPFSKYAAEAELLGADMAYKRKEWEEAAAAYRSFEELHPTHSRVDYAIFRRGLAYLQTSLGADRDQTGTRNAAEALQKLLFAHPQTQYAGEARERLTQAREKLAEHELYVARYYARKEEYEAALTRLRGLVQNYPETSHRDEALGLALELEAEKKGRGASD